MRLKTVLALFFLAICSRSHASMGGHGSTGNTWFVGSDGWTVFNGTVGNSGTACSVGSSSTWNGTCIAYAANGGNDSTCVMQPLVTAGVIPIPTAPCATPGKAQSLMRRTSDDWLRLAKGSSWPYGLNYNGTTTFNGAWGPTGGISAARPMLIGAYGSGAQPLFFANGYDVSCYSSTSNRGQYMALADFQCYMDYADPASPNYSVISTLADTNATTTLNNVGSTAGIGNTAATFTGTISGTALTWTGESGVLGVANGQQLGAQSGIPVGVVLSGCSVAGTTGSCALNQNLGSLGPVTMTSVNFSNWRVWGYGVAGSTISSFTSSTITLTTSSSLTATQTSYQIDPPITQGALNIAALPINFYLIEGVHIRYNGVGFGTTNTITSQIIFRRNSVTNGWGNNGTGPLGMFLVDNPFGGQILFEQNVTDHMGWTTSAFGGCGNNFTHDFYLHDWNPGIVLKSNIVSRGSATGVLLRPGGTLYNNLFAGNPLAISNDPGITSNSTSESYNVITNAADIIVQQRSATSIATSGTVVSIGGVVNLLNNNCSFVNSGNQLTDLDNPGAIPITANVASATSSTITMSGGTISGGVRGNGIQIGDRIVIYNTRGQGVIAQAMGAQYVGPGNANGAGGVEYYGGPSTVTVSASSPSIVTEPSSAFTRSPDEWFKFTSGTLPTGISLNTPYCTTSVTTLTYNFYPATGTNPITCPGVAGNMVNSTGSGTTGVGRTGTSLFFFGPGTSNPANGSLLLPPWVTIGMNFGDALISNAFPGNEGVSGATTIASISPGRNSLTLTDSSLVTIRGAEQNYFAIWSTGNVSYLPVQVISPNNVFMNSTPLGVTGAPITFDLFEQGANASNNYFYNWQAVASNNIQNFGNIGNEVITPQPLNVGGSAAFPTASIEYYDSTLQGNSFSGYITAGYGSGGTGGTLTVLSGIGPTIDDTIFGTGVMQYSKVTNCAGSAPTETCLVSISQTVGSSGSPVTLTSGSMNHFLTQAALNNHDSWNAAYTAAAANNFIRNAVGCVSGSTPPCPPQ